MATGVGRKPLVAYAPSRRARVMRLIRGVPSVEALAAMFFVLVIDYPTQLRFGANSVSAAITILLTWLLGILFVLNLLVAGGRMRPQARLALREGLRRSPVLLICFVIYGLVRLAMAPTPEGVQNLLCYAMFVLAILVAATSLRFDYRRVIRYLAWCAVASSALYLIQQLIFNTGEGGHRLFIGDRSYAMTALIGLAVLVPAKRRNVDPDSPPRSLFWPLFILAVLLFSLSRTALAVALVLLLFLAVRAHKRLRVPAVVMASISGVMLLALVVAVYPPILARFTEGDNAQVGGIRMNTSGRSVLWKITYDSAMRTPVWGHGPGDSMTVIDRFFAIPGVGHPHNDYLRVFNDLGFVGVVLFWGGMFALLIRCWRKARAQDEVRHWAAVMALLSVVLLAITDNVIVYQFIMMPVGVIVGISLRATAAAVPVMTWEWAQPARAHTGYP